MNKKKVTDEFIEQLKLRKIFYFMEFLDEPYEVGEIREYHSNKERILCRVTKCEKYSNCLYTVHYELVNEMEDFWNGK